MQAADATDLAGEVRRLIRRRAPHLAAEPSDELPLGAGGLGLDSIALAELLLDCGERFDVPPPAELLAGAPLTTGGLIAGVRAAVLRASRTSQALRTSRASRVPRARA